MRHLALVTAGLIASACAHDASMRPFATVGLPEQHDYLAPDGSEIRLLAKLGGGELSHCSLPAGAVSTAVRHETVEEIWYFLAGRGEVWRAQAGREEVVAVGPGTTLTIPLGTSFQFRNTGGEPLAFIIATMPPWPGASEAVPAVNHWPSPAQ